MSLRVYARVCAGTHRSPWTWSYRQELISNSLEELSIFTCWVISPAHAEFIFPIFLIVKENMERLDNWITNLSMPITLNHWLLTFCLLRFGYFSGCILGRCEYQLQTSGYFLLTLLCFPHEEGSVQRFTIAIPPMNYNTTVMLVAVTSTLKFCHFPNNNLHSCLVSDLGTRWGAQTAFGWSLFNSFINMEEFPYSVDVFFCKICFENNF